MAMKKPKPPVPGRPKPTPAKKKPAPKVPVTSVTPRSTVKKPSAKQVAGTRKVVANLAGLTPVGRGVKLGAKAVGKFDDAIYGLHHEYKKRTLTSAGKAKAGKKVNRVGIENNKVKTSLGQGMVSTVYPKGKNKKTRLNDYKAVMNALVPGSASTRKAIIKKELKKDKPNRPTTIEKSTVRSVKPVIKKKK
jgi:hypothetical protein